MKEALKYIEPGNKESLYSIFFDRKIKFQYPPTSLLFLYLLEAFGLLKAPILNAISWIFLGVMIFFVIQIFDLSLKKNFGSDIKDFSRVNTITRTIIIICLSITFHPVVKAYSIGQIQAWLNSMFAVAFWGWLSGKEKLAGGLIGTMLLIKPQYFIIALWSFLRKKWVFASTISIVTLSGLLTSIWLIGIDNHIDYLQVLSFISRRGESYYPNQSVNGLLNRLLFNGNNLN
jgi:hypothetical protein